MAKDQSNKQASKAKAEVEAAETTELPKESISQIDDAALEDLLADIDALTDTEVNDFVTGYIQKGGQ